MSEFVNGIELIPLGSLKRYLIASGWHRRTLPTGNELFVFAEDDEIEVVLPATSRVRDTHSRIMDAVATLTALESRSIEEVAAAIRSVSYDLVRSRLPDSAIRHDTIRLDVAEEFVRRMIKMLAASAHNEMHVGPYAQRLSSTAVDYANECRFGHTFRGSFGFTVESHVGPKSAQIGEIDPAPPLARRAVVRFARGLAIVHDAIMHEEPGEIVRAYDRGLNANAIEDLAALVEMPHVGEITFDIAFSPEWGVPEDVSARTSSRISQARGLEILREAAKELRVVNYEKLQTIVGKIRTLHSMETPSDLFTIEGLQDIYVEWDSPEFGKRTVMVSLGPEEYLQAVSAHTGGRTISVFGELEKGRRWRLDNARNFQVI